MSETNIKKEMFQTANKPYLWRIDEMPRPKKCRNVCCLPDNMEYGPLNKDPGGAEPIRMTVEEYETIRLIDHMGSIQEECAERMGVARTTVQDIYSKARKKIARSLVEGVPLVIEGGCYKVCEFNHDCRKHKMCRRNCGLKAISILNEPDVENEHRDTYW